MKTARFEWHVQILGGKGFLTFILGPESPSIFKQKSKAKAFLQDCIKRFPKCTFRLIKRTITEEVVE